MNATYTITVRLSYIYVAGIGDRQRPYTVKLSLSGRAIVTRVINLTQIATSGEGRDYAIRTNQTYPSIVVVRYEYGAIRTNGNIPRLIQKRLSCGTAIAIESGSTRTCENRDRTFRIHAQNLVVLWLVIVLWKRTNVHRPIVVNGNAIRLK